MILVISNIANEAAETLVDKFPPGAASLITASNFNQSFKGGICVSDFMSSHITVNNTKILAGDITGLITTIPYFFSQEFYYIQPADRNYVCAEMNAFFTYFLTDLRCKKMNPPSVRSFTGLSMFKTEWINMALKLNIPVWPVKLSNSVHASTEIVEGITGFKCTVIAGTIIGGKPPAVLCSYMHALQKALLMPYLQCYFIKTTNDDYYLADLSTVPDISNTLNREAIADYFTKNNAYDPVMGPDGRHAYEYGTR